MGRQFGLDVLNFAAGTSLILTNEMFLAFEELSANRVAAGVADLHLSANVRPGEMRD